MKPNLQLYEGKTKKNSSNPLLVNCHENDKYKLIVRKGNLNKAIAISYFNGARGVNNGGFIHIYSEKF